MADIPVAQLSPELPSLESKQFRAVVTLIWPFSSSTRQCALLLAESDFRLRRKKGQVRVSFTGSSARAIAGTGIGIGDEVVLGLRGACFVERDVTINTPGKGVEWDLCYSQTLVVQLYREGAVIADLEVINAAPTPAPGSPVRHEAYSTPSRVQPTLPSEHQQWSSPAFLKRSRLSDGPFFEAGYDPLSRDADDAHEKKRRRKSYRDWGVWTYSARTPSPEKDDVVATADLGESEGSPVRPQQLPDTPVSPEKSEMYSIAALPIPISREQSAQISQQEQSSGTIEENRSTAEEVVARMRRRKENEDFVRDADYYDLYAGPDEVPPSDLATEHEGNEEDPSDVESIQRSWNENENINIGVDSSTDIARLQERDSAGVTDQMHSADTRHEDAAFELAESIHDEEHGEDAVDADSFLEQSTPNFDNSSLGDAPQIIMPPPDLPLLQTDFPSAPLPGLLTPIGQEPLSPVIQPLDSSTLPMPSPFPGERDGDATSYLDHSSPGGQLARSTRQRANQKLAQEPSSEPDYVLESSFYSSVSASNTSAVHPTHESAFTDVRFTFGMDGSTFSRPKTTTTAMNEVEIYEDPIPTEDTPPMKTVDEVFRQSDDRSGDEPAEPEYPSPAEVIQTEVEPHTVETPPRRAHVDQRQQEQTDIIMLSSDTDSDQHENNQRVNDAFHESENEVSEPNLGPVPMPGQESSVAGDSMHNTSNPALILEELHPDDVPENGPVAVSDGIEDAGELSFIEEGLTTASRSVLEPTATQRSEAVTDIIDLGSGSDTDIDDAQDTSVPPTTVTDEQYDPLISQVERPDHSDGDDDEDDYRQITTSVSESSYSVPEQHHTKVDHSSKRAFVFPSTYSRPSDVKDEVEEPIVTVHQDSVHSLTDSHGDRNKVVADLITNSKVSRAADDGHLSQTVTHGLDYTNNVFPAQIGTGGKLETLDEDPNIKIESIEEDLVMPFPDEPPSQTQHDHADSYAGPSAELTIAIPEEGHKIGELQQISVSAAGPARNTRSKTKTSTSPVKNETPAPSRIRSTRSKTSTAPTTSTTLTPAQRKTRSTKSPVKNAGAESSYSLRSQSRMRSTSQTPSLAVFDKQLREPVDSQDAPLFASHGDETSSPPRESPTFEPIEMPDMPNFGFGSSQEFGIVPSNLANASFVKDSEEGSLHSEHSLSTVPYSDDYGYGTQIYANTSDPVEPYIMGKHSNDRRFSRETSMDASVTAETLSGSKTPIPQAEAHSPARLLEHELGEEVLANSPRPSDRSRQSVYDISYSAEARDTETVPGDTTPKAETHRNDVEYPELPFGPFESEDVRIPSSPPAPDDMKDSSLESIQDDEEAAQSAYVHHSATTASINEASLKNSNMPITPDATQQSFIETQPAAALAQTEQSFPLTPQLTQTASAGLRAESFTADIDMEEASQSPLIKPPTITSTTPRRNMTASDVASPSPSIHSEDLSDSDLEPSTQHPPTASPPSIGLTTPISYYTPLKDLSYFLNRASQAHANLTPDILALITSPTSPPKQAEKGPRDWSTTTQITDLSISPATRAVQIFRPSAAALPHLDAGDVVLLRGFTVRTLNRTPVLVSGGQGAWCVWRWGRPVWGVSGRRGAFGEVRAREEGGSVERGEGEWAEVERLRGWWIGGGRDAVRGKGMDGKGVDGKGKGKEVARDRDEEELNETQGLHNREETNGVVQGEGVEGVADSLAGGTNAHLGEHEYDIVDLTQE